MAPQVGPTGPLGYGDSVRKLKCVIVWVNNWPRASVVSGLFRPLVAVLEAAIEELVALRSPAGRLGNWEIFVAVIVGQLVPPRSLS